MTTPETSPPTFKYKGKGRPHLDSVCKALEQANGLITPAAQLMQMDASNLRKFVQHHPKCLAVVREARAKMKDFAESQTFSLMKDKHWGALQYFLSTQCQDRGYILPRGTQLGGESTTNTVVIGSVTITPIESGKFLDADGQAIECSIDGEVVRDVQTTKLN
jgi:hypothetical protein